ncbi:MAG: DUF4097 family beta strand repeat-containing protein [Streptococcaceae bacterium]|jgi:DUF4097 and DUF4098 domain-containing protein YvlB|nr:DUF4097 family beta strand repeat-containing protein [Streptococcaceae bacterium]
MTNKKERILDLMRQGIITESEAIELLEKAGLADDTGAAKDEGKTQARSTDQEGYQTDSSEAVKHFVNQAGSLMKGLFQSAKKSVDDTVDFSSGFPSFKHLTHSEFKAFDQPIRELAVTATSGDVTVVVKDVEKTIVEATYKVYGGVAEEALADFIRDNVIISLDEGQLRVAVQSKRIVVELTITLARHQLAAAKFNVVNGMMTLKDLVAENLTVKKVNGDLTVAGGKFGTAAIRNVNGEIKVSTDFDTADITNVNGEVLVTVTSLAAENLKVENVNGQVKISVPANIGLVGYVKTIFGGYKTRLKLDNPLAIGIKGAALVRTAINSLTLDVTMVTGTIWLKDGQPAPYVAEAKTSEQASDKESEDKTSGD